MSPKRRSACDRKLLDLWEAPQGAGEPVALLATSFTFDSDFFESECLARFAGLEGKLGEGGKAGDLAYWIELEERLATLDATVLVDRSYQSEGHPLRIDVLPVGQRSGLLHAKAVLLVWDGWVRFLIGSANLTPAGYRRQVESMSQFDAFEGSAVPRGLFDQAIAALRELVRLVPEDPGDDGPRARAERTLDAAIRELGSIDLPESWPGSLRAEVVPTRPGASALLGLRDVWKGGPPRDATVVSPFFDSGEGANRPMEQLGGLLAQRGDRGIHVLLPTEEIDSQAVVRAPEALARSAPRGATLEFWAFDSGADEDERRLHAKGILLESSTWAAALIGSSNFTTSGLGLSSSRGHLELNLALAAPAASAEGKALRALFDDAFGESIDPETVNWAAPEDDEEEADLVLPWGFQRALIDPGPPAAIELLLLPKDLPGRWAILSPEGRSLIDSGLWREQGSPVSVRLLLPEGSLPFTVEVHWWEDGAERSIAWGLNVTDRAKLPPREELRDLSVDQIVRTLSSSRPLPQALVDIVVSGPRRSGKNLAEELDPLRRYSNAGHLLARTREYSRALAGLKRHLSRPAYSLASLRWRLETAPWSPAALGRALMKEADSEEALPGEAAFRLAELARTLRSIDWKHLTRELVPGEAEPLVDSVLGELANAPVPSFEDGRLEQYVRDALAGVSR